MASIAPERLARLEQMLDREEILECVHRVSRGVDRFDREMFVSQYHPDAVIDAGAFVADPATVYDGGHELHEHGQFSTMHYILNHICELDGDVAHTETYYFYEGHNRDDTNWMAGGRYVDRFERRDGKWKIAFRCTTLQWSTMVSAVSVPLFDNVPDLHVNGAWSRGKDDISYRRPLTNLRTVGMPSDPQALSKPEG